MEWSLTTACLSLMCFFDRGNTEGDEFFKSVYVCCIEFVSGLILSILIIIKYLLSVNF